MNDLTKRMRELREEKGITQENVAEMLDVNRITYAGYEMGRFTPNAWQIVQLASYYGVTTDYLLALTDSKQPYVKTLPDIPTKDLLEEIDRRIGSNGARKEF